MRRAARLVRHAACTAEKQAMTPSIFLRITDGKLILWDYHRHAQYEIDLPHVGRLVELSALGEGGPAGVREASPAGSFLDPAEGSTLDADIRAAGLLDDPEPATWEWDCLARIFHVGSQIEESSEAACHGTDAYRGYV